MLWNNYYFYENKGPLVCPAIFLLCMAFFSADLPASFGEPQQPDTTWSQSDMEKRLALFDEYAVCFVKEGDGGQWNLGRKDGGYRWISLIEGIVSIGSHAPYIWGQSNQGYFLLLTEKNEFQESREIIHLYSTKTEWISALASYEAIDPKEMRLPEEMARSLTPEELAPWKYQYFRRACGLSDDEWMGGFLWAVFILCFVFGLCLKQPVLTAGLLGFVVGYLVFILLGRGAGLGLIGTVINAVIAAVLGKLARKIAKRVQRFIHAE